MNKNRRKFLRNSAALFGAGWLAGKPTQAQDHQHPTGSEPAEEMMDYSAHEMVSEEGFLPVHTPDIPKLPYEVDNGVKVFNLVAEPVKTEFAPGRPVDAWGYNGSVPGPIIEVVEGDRVRIIVDNHLPEITSVHWHGFEVPVEMDGVPGVTQDPIQPGGRFVYEFTLHQNGTFFYHSHMAMQEMMGMVGLFIMHPKKPHQPLVHKDFGIILQEWAILPNNTIPNTLSMEFNWLTLNGKVGPATTPLIVKQGERVRIRVVNLGMDHHPFHLHGVQFYLTGTEGGRAPESTWYPTNTVLVGVAQAKDFEFDAIYTGDWVMHCHLPHHMMNGMVSMVGPMAHGSSGVHPGMGMEEGMGIVEGHAMAEELGPSLGRATGISTFTRPTSNVVGRQDPSEEMDHSQHMMNMNPDARSVPGYPQDDMWMPMDAVVAKPETYGMRPGWSAGVMGMMTVVRVLESQMYDEVMTRIKEGGTEPPPAQPMQHQHQM